jgi:DNA-binding CsgD family transcriptional regulator
MARRAVANPLDVIEAAYDLDRSDRAWLENLAKTVRPLLDGGNGIIAYQFDQAAPIESWFASAIAIDTTPLPKHYDELAQSGAALTRSVHLEHTGLLTMTGLMARLGLESIDALPHVRRYLEQARIRDMAALQTVEPGGRGVVFVAGQAEQRAFDVRTQRLWARVNAHIAAGRRLRASLADAAPGGVAEAVLKPSGALEHAEGDSMTPTARTILRDAVLRQERARTRRARLDDPTAATDAWTALVAGRWSLVDRFEENGRRYIVARRNEHGLADPRALTPRERAIAHLAALGKPNKLIAYELGLSESTIGSHLSAILRKLGLRSRVELIGLHASLTRPPER